MNETNIHDSIGLHKSAIWTAILLLAALAYAVTAYPQGWNIMHGAWIAAAICLITYGRIEIAAVCSIPTLLICNYASVSPDTFGIDLARSTDCMLMQICVVPSIISCEGILLRYTYGVDRVFRHTAVTAIVCVALSALLFVAGYERMWISIAATYALSAFVSAVIFWPLITSPSSKHMSPYTFFSIIRSALVYIYFALGCIAVQLIMIGSYAMLCGQERRREIACKAMHYFCQSLFAVSPFMHCQKVGKLEDENKPCIIIANHQSFLDILRLLALTPKVVMMVKPWVWNSPIFGLIVRHLGYICVKDGYDAMAADCKERMQKGYSVVVFPEGSRSADGRIGKFHKGAFVLAKQLNADIQPIIFCGNPLVVPKLQPMNMCTGLIQLVIKPRIKPDDTTYGETDLQRTKSICRQMRKWHDELMQEYPKRDDSVFYHRLVRNYLYKGPVVEWYVRVKTKMEVNYREFDKMIPSSAKITDIGCGMGQLSHMLAMRSPSREILGIDYDEKKIAIAQNTWLKKDNLKFECRDASKCDMENADVFIISDMLHYLPTNDQKQLISNCARHLNTDGKIIVRDADSGKKQRHWLTKLTEIFSTKILRFNKTKYELDFLSMEDYKNMAKEFGLVFEAHDNDEYTSNTIYTFIQPNEQ